MDQPFLRLLIQEKLADGRLPRAPIPRVWGGPGHGETCDGCGETVTVAQLVMEGSNDAKGRGVQFHVGCFHVWNVERQGSGHEPGVRLPARSAFSASGARSVRSWAPVRRPPVRPAPRPHDARVGKHGNLAGAVRAGRARGDLPWPLRRRASCQKPAIGCARPAATAPWSRGVPS